MVKWLSTIKQADESSLTIEKMALDSKGFPQPTGEFETIEADSLVLALGQDVDLGLLEGVPGLEVSDGVVRSRQHDDRSSGNFRRWRHGSRGTQRHRRHRSRQAGGAAYRCLAARRGARSGSRNTRWPTSRTSTPGITPTHRKPCARCWTSFVASRLSMKSRAASTRARPVRSPPLPVLRQLLRMRQLLRRLPGQCGDQARPRQALQFNYDYCKGCGMCVAECPMRRDQDGGRRNLIACAASPFSAPGPLVGQGASNSP
jgi:hypothetical protein